MWVGRRAQKPISLDNEKKRQRILQLNNKVSPLPQKMSGGVSGVRLGAHHLLHRLISSAHTPFVCLYVSCAAFAQ